MMTSNIEMDDDDDRLTCPERVCICRAMVKHLNIRRYVDHMIAPVGLYPSVLFQARYIYLIC